MSMSQHVTKYIESKQLAWAPSTLKSESHRLAAMVHHMDGTPATLWAAIKDRAPYTRLTMWTRAIQFYQWCMEKGHVSGPNTYKEFKSDNRRLFKHVYQTNTPTISYKEAATLISQLPTDELRAHANILLSGGLRFSESLNIRGEQVVGKGSKPRTIFLHDGNTAGASSYHSLRRALARVGLKPHDLRKLCASELARQGLREADLCKVMGWSSFATAKAYLAPMQDAAISKVFERMRGAS